MVRRRSTVGLLMLLAACSSTTPTDSGGSAAFSIQSGDNQSALAGTLLPARPTVLVKDAFGASRPNVVVTFSIDSGGGSLSAATATTGADGVAVSGGWTLGPAAGSNVVRATIDGAVLRFHAQALGAAARPIITNGVISTGGGTLTYIKPGDPLNGLTLTVPVAAYPVATTWSIVADTTTKVPLPSGFSQLGPVLIIGNGQGYSDSNMTLTVPMPIAATDAVVPFYFDPVSKTLEPIPMVDITDTSATLATTHFSGDLMAIPGKPPVAHASLRAGFGNVRVVWVRTPVAQLTGTFTSTFVPGVDDWEFVNTGDYLSPLGDCEGMSVSEMYYHYYYRQGDHPGPGLYHQFDVSLQNPWDNVQGYHLVGTVQKDVEDHLLTGVGTLNQLIVQRGKAILPTVRSLTVNWILLTLKLNKAPVLLILRREGGGHAIVAYAASSDGTNTVISVADPNDPGKPSSMAFAGGALTPVDFRTNASALAATYHEVYAVGVTAEVALAQLETRWSEFLEQKAGADRFPPGYRFVSFNDDTEKWEDLGPTLFTYSSNLLASVICDACPVKTLGADPTGLMLATVYDANGVFKAPLGTGNSIALKPGNNTFVITGQAWSPYESPGKMGFLDMLKVVVTSVQLSVVPDHQFRLSTQPVTLTFTANPNNLPAHVQYVWDFGDHTAPVTIIDNPVAVHAYATADDWTVSVTATDLTTHKTLPVQQTIIGVTAPPIWRFTSVSLASEVGPVPAPPDNPSINIDIKTLADAKALVSRVVTTPSDGLLIYAGADYRTQIGATPDAYDLIELQIASAAGTGAAITRLASTGVTSTPLGLQCSGANCFLAGTITSTGTTITGALAGKASPLGWPFAHSGVGGHGVFVNIPGDWNWWQMSATKNGTTMTGTITYNQNIANTTSDAFLGTHVVTWNFTAAMVP